MPKFAVFFEQVNQEQVVVTAKDETEAREKAYRKWRKDVAHTRISAVQPCTNLL